MCGIVAVYAYRSTASGVDTAELSTIRDYMTARGPDDADSWIAPGERLGLGHRRLAVIDLDRQACQPMVSSCGRYRIVFNGEIYNYRELRARLEARGVRLRTRSDTEVLLELFARDGRACLGRLRGMYAFAIWDERARALWLARDPYGIKPLYYADDGRTVRVASQVKALLAGGAIETEPDPAGLAGFYLWGSVPEPLTLYRQVEALPPGHLLRFDADGARPPEPFLLIEDLLRDAGATAAPVDAATLREALCDSVRAHLEADVPIGLFLSAGIDSCAVLAAIAAVDPVRPATMPAITLHFPDYRGGADDEAPLAGAVARRYGARQIVRTVDEAEFQADLPRILAAMDQPSIDGVNVWFVAKAARELGLKVALSGLGGDELLGGYPSFRQVPRLVAALRWPARLHGLGRAYRRLAQHVGPRLPGWHPKAAGLLEHGGSWLGAYLLRRGLFLPHELGAVMPPELVTPALLRLQEAMDVPALLSRGPSDGFGRMAMMESKLYMRNQLLRDSDWASMAHSIELRLPLVDVPLLRAVAPLARRRPGKQLLVEAMALPAEIGQRPKTGFTTPVGQWLARAAGDRGDRSTPWIRRWAMQIARGFTVPRPTALPVGA